MDNIFIFIKILILLWSINLTPVLLAFFFEKKWDTPLDRGMLFIDGKPFLGSHKTMRGALGGIMAGILVGFVTGISLWVALLAGILSMLGDMLNSFIKRRFRMLEGTDFPVMDQLLEGALPFVILAPAYALSFTSLFSLILVFVITAYLGGLFLTRVLRTKPFAGYSRKLRSKIRFREWRACETIEYPFHPIINIERTLYYHWFMKTVFRVAGLYEQGKKNALDLKLRKLRFEFDTLPRHLIITRFFLFQIFTLTVWKGLPKKPRTLLKN